MKKMKLSVTRILVAATLGVGIFSFASLGSSGPAYAQSCQAEQRSIEADIRMVFRE